ncbi:MAG: AraC family transcriptional regulator ligand-binding domain-containing protein [Hahellaceae bacterium]|nr:AraC family transcriptional regulator ligand-binding domain-containing protein [Hahellaceae bacterium]
MKEVKASAIVLSSILKTAALEGIDPKPFLQKAGIQLNLEQLETGFVDVAAIDCLLNSLSEASSDHCFALRVGENFAFDYLPEVETYIATSTTLRDAEAVFEWIRRLINPLLDLAFVPDGKWVYLRLQHSFNAEDLDARCHNESIFAAISKFSKLIVNQRSEIASIEFDHPEPDNLDEYRRVFGIPMRFSQPYTQIRLHASLLDSPFKVGMPELREQAIRKMRQRMASTDLRLMTQRLLQCWSKSPVTLACSLEQMACTLTVSARTLQRRLKDESTNYAELQDQARFLRVKELLQQNVTMEDISEQLGFSDRRSFTRAFKRWSGASPRAWRNLHRTDETM